MANSPQILIVDDEADICANMADIFTDRGYRVDIANSGPAALRLVDQHRYDIALLDLMMPGMDGAELYHEIKKRRAETTAILVTAYPEHPRASFALANGAWRLLAKPVELPKLFGLIDQAAAQPLLLLVDDDADFCANIWDVLHEQNYRIALAHDISTAQHLLAEDCQYNLVLLDMRLPDGDFGAILRLAGEMQPSLPIILVTGYRSEYERKISEGLTLGVDDVLQKPLDVAKLLDAVHRFANKAK